MTTAETSSGRLRAGNGHADPQGVPTLEVVTEAPTKRAPVPRTSHVVLRRVQPWSVLKLSLLFYLCVCAALLVAGVSLWLAASALGVIGNLESFFQEAGFDEFQFSAAPMLRAFTLGGIILVVAGTVANLLLAMLFNLMSDVVGGLRLSLEEDLHSRR